MTHNYRKISGKRTVGSILAVAVLAASAQPVSAQLEEVVVTAQKRSESIQDVPIAMQALSGEQLEEQGVASASDVLNLFANVGTNASSDINVGFTIRGVGTNNFHVNAVSAVGVYQDEISLASPFNSVLGLYDMERVEVLRGPQNTLYGRNTTGGAVNYITQQPDVGGGVNGFIKGGYGNYNQTDLDGAIGVPLGETAALRAAFQVNQRDGLFEDVLTGREYSDQDRVSGRVTFAWEPSDTTDIKFNVHYGNSDANPRAPKTQGTLDPDSAAAAIGAPPAPPIPLCDDLSSVNNFEAPSNCSDPYGFVGSVLPNGNPTDWDQVYSAAPSRSEVELKGTYLRIAHAFENMDFTSISAYDETDVQFNEDNGGTPNITLYPMQDASYEQFSQEFRLSGETGSTRWLAGLGYFREESDLGTNVRRGGRNVATSSFLQQENEMLSAYGQADYEFGDDFTLTFGLRYTDETIEGDNRFSAAPAGPDVPSDTFLTNEMMRSATTVGGVGLNGAPVTRVGECPPGPGNPPPCELLVPDIEISTSEWGGKIGLSYQLDDDSLVYGHYSRGFKSGGIDVRALVALSGGDPRTTTEPEFLDAYEIGLKSELAGGRVQANIAVFYYEWQDLQAFAVIDGIPGFYNVPESELMGVELEGKWAATENLYFQGSLGFLDTEITDNGGIANFQEGHALSNSPELTFNGLAQYDIAFGQNRLTLQADVRYVDEQQTEARDTPYNFDAIDSQFFLNARATYRFGSDEEYELVFWGENLTEERACTEVRALDNLNSANRFNLLTGSNVCTPTDGQVLYGVTGRWLF